MCSLNYMILRNNAWVIKSPWKNSKTLSYDAPNPHWVKVKSGQFITLSTPCQYTSQLPKSVGAWGCQQAHDQRFLACNCPLK